MDTMNTLLLLVPCQINLFISSRGSFSDHDAVFLRESDIFFWLSMVLKGMMNTSLNKIFLKYSLVSPVVVSLYTRGWHHR